MKVVILVLMCIGIYYLMIQRPIDFPKLSGAIAIALLTLFITTPLFRKLNMSVPYASLIVPLLLFGGIAIYVDLKESPVNYARIATVLFIVFSYTLIFTGWSRQKLLQFPSILVIITAIFACIEIFLIVTSHPANNLELFWNIAVILTGFIGLFIQYLIFTRRKVKK